MVLQEFLVEVSGITYFEGTRFSGVKIIHDGSIIIGKVNYIEGVVKGKVNQFLLNKHSLEVIKGEDTYFEDASGILIFKNNIFTGHLYSFRDNKCSRVEEYDAGWESSKMSVSSTGFLSLLHRNGNSITETINWDNDGNVQHYEAWFKSEKNKKGYSLCLNFIQNKVLNRFLYKHGFFEKINSVKDQFYLQHYLNLDNVFKLGIGEELFLGFSGITNKIFKRLVAKDEFNNCRKLTLVDNSVDVECLVEEIQKSSVEKMVLVDIKDKALYRELLSSYQLDFIN